MNRPRPASVISAVCGSTSAFVVLTRWGLLGTLAGAVMFPVVYTLVSHGSTAGMERLSKWTQSRMGKGKAPSEPEQTKLVESAKTPVDNDQAESIPARTPRKLWIRGLRRLRVQWPVALVSVMALTVSVYALTQADLTTRVVVRETVVEKTVTSEVPRTSVVYVTVPADTGAEESPDDSQTATTLPDGEEDGSGTTDTTLPDDPTSTTLPPTTSTTLP